MKTDIKEVSLSAQCVSSIGQIIKSVCVSVSQWVSESVSEWVSHSVNFGTPSISRERLKLESSNLAHRLATAGPNEKNAKWGQMGSTRGHVTYFLKFWDPSISRERLKLETSNLAHRLATGGPNEKKCKIRSKWVLKGSRDLLFEFWDPLHISGTAEDRNFKFGTQIGHWES